MPTVAPVEVDGFVVRAGYLKDTAFFASGEGDIVLSGQGETKLKPHKAGLLAAEPTIDGKGLITSGDDGCIFLSAADGSSECVAERPRKWIDLIAAGPSGALAFASGRTAWVRFADGREKEIAHERAVGGLAFAPKGMRLAVGRYDGATLWWAGTDGAPVELSWNGAHLGVSFSPDGKYVVTAMQENALHGWRIDTKPNQDFKHMRMTGYPAKIRSYSWSRKGAWLVTSGAPSAIAWPFQGKDGPMGKAPKELGFRGDTMVTCVACHPVEDMVAIGYADGMVLAVRLADSQEALLRRPGKGAVTAMDWNAAGRMLTFGCETGECGVIDISI